MYQFHSFLWLYNIPLYLYTTGRMSIQLLCPFLNWVVFLLLSCKDSLYVKDINSLSGIQFENIFSHSFKKYIYVSIWLHWSSCGMQGLVPWPHDPCVGSVEFWPLDHQGSPSPILGVVSSLSVVSLSLIKFILSIFSFVVCTFGVISKKSLPNPMLWRFLPVFSSESLYF